MVKHEKKREREESNKAIAEGLTQVKIELGLASIAH